MLLAVLPLVLTVMTIAAPSDSSDCLAAARFLRGEQQMVAVIDRDTIDDWRTQTKVVGCRITAAGATTLTMQQAAVRMYERVRAAGWTRTPDPRDAPTEASLRFRWEQSDCLFNFTPQALLGTRSEGRVNGALVLKDGESRYQVLVLCMPAMPAKPRPDRLQVRTTALAARRWPQSGG